MLRVNLLPPYIYDKQKKVRVAVLWGAVLAAVIVLMALWTGGVSKTLGDENAHLDQAKNYQTTYQDTDTKITDVETKNKETLSKQTFIADAKTYNASWPRVYEAMASVTSPDILLKTMSVTANDHHTLRLTGFCPTEMNLARWWMALRNDTAMFDSVNISLPSHPWAPETGNGQGGGPGGGGGLRGGFPGGMPGGFPGGMPGMGGRGGMPGFPGGGSSPGAMGRGGLAGLGGGGKGGFGGFGGRGGFGGGNSADVGPTEIEGRRGLNFVAICAVKDTLAPPAAAPMWPVGGAGGGVGAGGFPGGGMPGGGMPPGMLGGGMPGRGMPAGGAPGGKSRDGGD